MWHHTGRVEDKKNIYGFDLTPDLCDDGFHLVKHGNIPLKLKFTGGLGENFAVCVAEDRDNLLEIDFQRDVRMISPIL